jgi:hypothetical protein
MGYSCRLYKKAIPNCKFIKGRFQTIFLKINILQIVMFQNVFMNIKISKEKQISMSIEIFVSFQKKKRIFVSFQFHTHISSYKCKYVLFHLNMLKLFQEINMFFFFEIKVVSNKKFSHKYLIQGFNPHSLSWFNVYPPYYFQNFDELKKGWLIKSPLGW